MKARSLAGYTLLITRPKHQAEPLSILLKTTGANTILFPTLLIKLLHNTKKIRHILNHIQDYDIAIFVSANAAIPFNNKQIKIIAIGPGTAKALKKNNMNVNFIPKIYSSNGILALPILKNVKNKRIVIFCGENSNPLLKDTLLKRDATVDEAICYRRECPIINETQLKQLQSQSIDLVISTSKESLQNLARLFPKPTSGWIYHKHSLVISEGMANLAHQLGFNGEIIIAKNASDQVIVDTLINAVVKQKIV